MPEYIAKYKLQLADGVEVVEEYRFNRQTNAEAVIAADKELSRIRRVGSNDVVGRTLAGMLKLQPVDISKSRFK